MILNFGAAKVLFAVFSIISVVLMPASIQFGLVMTIGLMIGIIMPPFGICLFVVSEVGQVPVKDTTREALKYLPAMVVVLLLVIFIPELVTWLPNTLLG